MHQIAAPAVLGLTGVMLSQPSAVSVVALTRSEAEFIARANFLRVLAKFPQTALAFSQLIAGELAQTYSHLSQLRIPRAGSVSSSAR